ncbi:hypothetical protein [Halomonas sp. 3H]|uniref:hypothetical protein n=1 Tax=Halomonas sp. 3H TaxID=2952527 RepID=UPI0020B70F72|nr:hypothetical protein [Halomonas sp. 3H]
MTSSAPISSPRMDLRTNVIDLGLDPHRPGAGDRAAQLAERLLSYCHAQLLPGESLAIVPLLYPEEQAIPGEVDVDPDAPEQAARQEEEGGDDPLAVSVGETRASSRLASQLSGAEVAEQLELGSGDVMGAESLDWDAAWVDPISDTISGARLGRMAAARATRLIALTHGYGRTQARSLRFACVLDVGMWGNRPQDRAASVMGIFGGHRPDQPMDTLWRQATKMDGAPQWRKWVYDNQIHEWGGRRGMQGKIALVRLMTLAFRVSLRRAGLDGDARDHDMGLLLGEAVLLQASLDRSRDGAGVLRGYEVRLELDARGRLVVEMPRRVQRLPAELADALSEAPYRLGSRAVAVHSLCLARRYKLNATRFGSQMEFFYFLSGSRQSRLEHRVRTRGVDPEAAAAWQDDQTRRVMNSGLVLKNRGMDLVEAFLDELGEDVEWKSERFQPTQVTQVAIRKAGTQQPAFRDVPVTDLQIVYSPELRRDSRWPRLHDGLIQALEQKVAAGGSATELNWRVVDTLEETVAANPVLYVQLPETLRTSSGAQRPSSAWYELTRGQGRKPLVGFSHALAVRELERERGRGAALTFDPYTTLKLEIHDAVWSAWRPIQGLNLTLDMVDALSEGVVVEKSLLAHKLREIIQELRLKQGLGVRRAFVVRHQPPGVAQDAGLIAMRPSDKHYVCLKALSHRGAPARAAIMEFWWHQGELHIGQVAIASHRLPRDERVGGGRRMKSADVARRQIARAYEDALTSLEAPWCAPLCEHVDHLAASKALTSGQTLLYSVVDDTLLREEQVTHGKPELLGATWRDFPFESLLTDGQLGSEHLGLNMGRSGSRGRVPLAQQLIGNAREDVYLQPEEAAVRGFRALISTQQSVLRNNPVIEWRVQGRDPEAPDRIGDLHDPHLAPVFKTYVETLTRDLLKVGQVSRMSLPGKLVSVLVGN